MPGPVSEDLRPVISFALLGALLAAGHALRARVRVLRVLSLPASCVGGITGLAAHQLLLRSPTAGRFVNEELIAGWEQLPSLLTNIVFVTLVLGEPLPSPKQLWALSGPQLAFGQLLAFGQYAACSLVTAVWLQPSFGVPRLFAAIVPLGYEGGHGVVAGNAGALERYGYPEGVSLGYVAATVGLLVGTLLGCALANWARWRGLLASSQPIASAAVGTAAAAVLGDDDGSMTAAEESMPLDREAGGRGGTAAEQQPQPPAWRNAETRLHAQTERRAAAAAAAAAAQAKAGSEQKEQDEGEATTCSNATIGGGGGWESQGADFDGCYPEGSPLRPSLGTCVVAVSSIDSLAHHFSLVGTTLAIAWCAKLGVAFLAGLRGRENDLLSSWIGTAAGFIDPLPLFLYALLCAVLVQAIMDRSSRVRALLPIDRATTSSICATAMDFLIVSAIATIDFDELKASAVPFMVCCVAATAWVVLCFVLFARLLPDYWVERAVTEVGLALGATATALLVLRMMDPENRTPVLRAFCYKQLVNVMLVGGGIFTSSSLTIAFHAGPWGLFAVSVGAAGFWLAVLIWLTKRHGVSNATGGGGGDSTAEPLLAGR